MIYLNADAGITVGKAVTFTLNKGEGKNVPIVAADGYKVTSSGNTYTVKRKIQSSGSESGSDTTGKAPANTADSSDLITEFGIAFAAVVIAVFMAVCRKKTCLNLKTDLIYKTILKKQRRSIPILSAFQ